MSGRIICDLSPSQFNNRNSEGAFLKLNNGMLLFAYTRYRNDGLEDHCTADIYGVLSDDDGESFCEPFLLFSCEDVGADNVMSVSLLRLHNGDLGLFYLQKHNTVHTCVPYLAVSSDEGKTWKKHIRCIQEDGYYVLNNDRIIVLDTGRILIPVAKHHFDNGAYLPGTVFMYSSDDNGNTWRRLSDAIELNPSHGRHRDFEDLHNAMEPGVVQLEDGTVWCYIRTVLGRQYETFSQDFGQSWEVPQPSPFSAPGSPMCVKKLKNGKLFAVWNPIPEYNGRVTAFDGTWTGGRTPLVYAILDANGSFDGQIHPIETDKESGFCYCAIYETDGGDILLGYCAGGVSDKSCLSRLRIRKISQKEL